MAIHKLRALEYLVSVVDTGGFAAAGRALGVAPASVHRLVNALEREVGATLLVRDGGKPRPTPEGAAYVERARRILSELADLEQSLHDTTKTPSGTLVIASHSVVTKFVLADLLPAFLAACPGVRVDLRDAGAGRDLGQLGADLLLLFGWPPAQDAILRTLARTRWLVVATPAFWNLHGVPDTPADLARYPCALFRTPYGEVLDRWTFARGDLRAEVRVDGPLVGDDRNALDAPLLAGRLVARVNDLTARDALARGLLQPVLLDWDGLHSPPLNLLYRKSLARQPRVRAFVDFIRTSAEALATNRLPSGMPEPRSPTKPDWFRKRVG